MFVNPIIYKKSTKYHYLLTMANGDNCAHKLGEQNKQQLGVTNENLNTTSPTSFYCYSSIGNIDVASK